MATHSKHNLLEKFSTQPENRNTFLSDLFDLIESDNLNIFSSINYQAEPSINKPLSHLVLSVKNILTIENFPFTASSEILDNFVTPYTSTAIKNLANDGATIIGTTNLDEFAIGSSGSHSKNETALNPLNHDYIVGGSSSGAAASVTAELCHVAIASDTGGSARVPAAMTGVIGFKPSYGSVSRQGLLSFAPSYDQIAFMSKSIESIKEVYISARGDDFNNMSSNVHSDVKFRGHTIGVFYLNNISSISSDIIDNYNSYCDYLMDLGFMISEIDILDLEEIVAAYQVLTSLESASNLSRFTGLNYGKNKSDIGINRSKFVGSSSKNRIILGNYLLTQDSNRLIDKAETLKNRLKQKFTEIFTQVDVVITPTTPLPARKTSEPSDKDYFYDTFTCIANLIGSPALCFPYGVDTAKMPLSMQIIAPKYSDLCLLDFYKEL